MPNLNAVWRVPNWNIKGFLQTKKISKRVSIFFFAKGIKSVTETAETKPLLVDVSGIGNKSERDLF
jgi:hypothetical protein